MDVSSKQLDLPTDTLPAPAERMTPWLAVCLLVVLFAGGLFGYDQGVISGALSEIKQSFSLSVLMIQVVTSWITPGALMGSLAGALFTIGAIKQRLAPEANA